MIVIIVNELRRKKPVMAIKSNSIKTTVYFVPLGLPLSVIAVSKMRR
jgi:hypothetical protein